MRGADGRSGALFSYVDLEVRVPHGHPLRTIRLIVNEALAGLSPGFHDLYARVGRPSIAPEMLLRALLLQAFYGVRSERQLMERLDFDLLFRWFVGLGVDDPVWDASTFSKNRDRLLAGEVAQRFLAELVALPEVRRLISSEHFSVDGTLLQAWASLKSFRAKDGGDSPPGPGRNGARNFKGEKRSNATHASTTDPDARLYRKGDGERARLCYIGHALMENRNGLMVGGVATRATSDAEPLAAIELVKGVAGRRRLTLGADKAYDTANFVLECREENVTPHVAQNITTTRGSRIDGRTTRHAGYAVSLRIRKRIEEGFGWIKIRTNNPLERIMREIRRRTRVVGAFPDGQSCLNLAAARLRHIAGTQWSTRKYMNMAPLRAVQNEVYGAAIA